MTSQPDSAELPMRTIPAFDYLEGLRVRREEILSAIARVIDSGPLILGAEVAAFEQE